MLCSKVCRYHFIQRNESLASCSFCSEWEFDLYMLQLIDQQQSTTSSALHYFCSGSCYELFVESKSDCIDGDRDDCGDGQEMNDDERVDDDYDEADDVIMYKTASTQTDELIIKCSCDTIIERHMFASK